MKKLFTLLCTLVISINTNAQCWQSIAVGQRHTLGIKADGTLWSWGYALGNSPHQIGTATDWQTIAAGDDNSFAIKTDGTLWSWGRNNDHGELGLGNFDSLISYYINPQQVGTDTNWQSIATGFSFVLAIKTDSTLWTWGKDDFGQLGDGGSNIDRNTPMQIGTDTDWRDVYAGYYYAHAIKTNGTLWGWGNNFYGNLGNGGFGVISETNPAFYVPTQIGTDTDWLDLSPRNSWHVLGLKTNGTLWAWGENFRGALGDGTTVNKYLPIQIGVDTNWVGVFTGGHYHSHAIKSNGTLWSWGYNLSGAVGDGTLVDRYTPIQIGTDTNWHTLTSGGVDFSMAIKADGSLWGWGNNGVGQLGNGKDESPISSPIAIACPTSTLGVESFTNIGFKVFPNPVKDMLKIQNTSNLVLDHIVIRDVLGKTVVEQKGNESQINVSNLHQGLYILQIQSEGNLFSTKIIKQ